MAFFLHKHITNVTVDQVIQVCKVEEGVTWFTTEGGGF